MTCEFQFRPETEAAESVGSSTIDQLSEELLNEEGYWSCPHPKEGDECYCCFHLEEQPETETLVDRYLTALVTESTSTNATRRNEFVGATFREFDLHSLSGTDNRVEVIEDIDVYLEKCHFSGLFDIRNFDLGNELSLMGSKFDSDLYASGIQCDQGVNLTGVKVAGKVEITDAEFSGDTFFSNITVSDRADFSKTVFRGYCSYEGATFNSGIDLQNVVFTGGRPSGNPAMNRITAPQSNLSGANLTGADFREASIQWVNLKSTVLSRSSLDGADLRAAQLSGTTFGDTTINDSTKLLGHPDGTPSFHTWLPISRRDYCISDPRFEGDTSVDGGSNIVEAISVYKTLERLATTNAMGHLAKESFVRRQELKERRNRKKFLYGDNLSQRLFGFVRGTNGAISRYVFQYGESPWRVVLSSFFCIIAFAGLYDGFELLTVESSFLDALYYSTLIFTTLGFAEAQPAGIGQFLTTVESGLGTILVALLVFVLGRRATR